MTLHLAVKLLDARRSAYEPALAQHGTVHWCGSGPVLGSVVAAGAAVALVEIGSLDYAETLDVITRLHQEHPGLLVILAYDPVGEELGEAVRLVRRRLGFWFAWEPDDELDLLLARAAAGRISAGPTPAQAALECIAELAPAPAARRFASFHGLTPSTRLDEAAAASRCGEKLRTVQRQFADIGVTAGAVRRAFQTLHAAFWLRGNARNTNEIASIFGRPSARALRDSVRDVLGFGVHELRRSISSDAFGRELANRLRSG